MYGSAQAAIQHVVFRPLRGGRQDPPPALQQPRAPALREPEREEERDRWAGGDADHSPQPRRRAEPEGNQVNRMGNRNHEENNRPEIRQRRPNRPREEQRKVYVETLRNADLYSGDETDTLQGAAAEDSAEVQQHMEDKPPTDEENKINKTSEDNNTEPKHSEPASQEQAAEMNRVENTTSGDTQNDVSFMIVSTPDQLISQ